MAKNISDAPQLPSATAVIEQRPMPTPRLISAAAVLELIPIAKATMWRMISEGTFPQPVRIGKRRVAFFLDEVEAWLAVRAAERKTPGA